jgi:hypothetical protein
MARRLNRNPIWRCRVCHFISLPTGTSHRVSLPGHGESCVHAGIQMFLAGVASAGFSAASADQVVPAKWLKGGGSYLAQAS